MLALIVGALLLSAAPHQSVTGRIEGTVESIAGARIAGARVRLQSQDRSIDLEAESDGQGAFDVEVPPGRYRIEVSAGGFATQRQTAELKTAELLRLQFQLEAAAAPETIVVTATRLERRLDQQMQNVTLLAKSQLETSPALSLDDTLRQLPGFSLFRRSSSLAAHPTAQGVSLRGVGPSGVSRTLVLWDEVPLNDPFGNWVAWNQVPGEVIERIEVMRGAGSELYGSSALGGVLQVISRQDASSWSGNFLAGNLGVGSADAFVSGTHERWIIAAGARGFRTGGYHQVAEKERGAIDRRVRSAFGSGWLRAQHRANSWNAALAGNFYHDERINGTALQRNQTNLGRLAMSLSGSTSANTLWHSSLYWQQSEFHSSFSRITANRQSEFLTSWQQVPARAWGASGMWARHSGSHLLSVGADWKRVAGESDERLYDTSGTRVTGLRDAGGTQQMIGVFGQNLWSVHGRLDVQAAVRLDGWSNSDGFLRTAERDVLRTTSQPERRLWNLSSRGGALYRFGPQLLLRGSAYRSFRAPTLNELYRPFRLGNVETRANATLDEETLLGGEGALEWLPQSNLTVRAGWFLQSLRDSVSNVTLLVEPNRILRERRNLGRVRVSGAEFELGWTHSARLRVDGGYLWNRTRVTEFSAQPELVGKRLPQVPHHQASIRLLLQPAPAWSFSLQGRLSSRQFDDDLNQLPLGYFNVVDARAGYKISEAAELFAQVENIFDRVYLVARSPVALRAAPFQFQAGVRLRGGK